MAVTNTNNAETGTEASGAPFQQTAIVIYSGPATEPLYVKVETMEMNLKRAPTKVTVTDARGLPASLDVQGFETFVWPTQVKDWDSEEDIKAVYYPEAVDLVKQATGAKSATVFDYTIRRAAGAPERKLKSRDPVFGVHVDYTDSSAEKRLEAFYGVTADELRKGRWAIVNLWRPVAGVVKDLPLGFIDASSVAEGDYVPYDLIYSDRVGGNLTVTPNPDHRWYYYHHQAPEEVHIFKQYDSNVHVARRTPHTGFKDGTMPKQGGFIPRESIELRMFVFYDMDLGLPIVAEEPGAAKL